MRPARPSGDVISHRPYGRRTLTPMEVDGFKADLGSALCRRFLTDDMDGLAAAYLKQGDGWVGTRTRNARKLAERLGGDAYRRI